MENPLDSMTWEERFKFAFHAVLVLECKYEDALAELRSERANMLAVSSVDPNSTQRVRERYQIRKLRVDGLNYNQIKTRLGQIRQALGVCHL